MPHSYFKSFMHNNRSNRGFTLIEMLVVMVIIGILAVGVVFMFTDPTAKVKAAAFEMRGDFNLARAEAVNNNTDVLMEFDPATDSYRICIDDWDIGLPGAGSDGACTDGSDTMVKAVVFKNKVRYYRFNGAAPASGPENDPLGNSLNGENGITLGATTLTFKSNGTCDETGSVVVYYPKDGDPATLTIKGRPYAIVVEGIGHVYLERWNPVKGDWSRK